MIIYYITVSITITVASTSKDTTAASLLLDLVLQRDLCITGMCV